MCSSFSLTLLVKPCETNCFEGHVRMCDSLVQVFTDNRKYSHTNAVALPILCWQALPTWCYWTRGLFHLKINLTHTILQPCSCNPAAACRGERERRILYLFIFDYRIFISFNIIINHNSYL